MEVKLTIPLFNLAAYLWLFALLWTLLFRHHASIVARSALSLGCGAALVGIISSSAAGTTPIVLPITLIGQPVYFQLGPTALWLLGFGLVPTFLACWFGGTKFKLRPYWLTGTSSALLGALGVFGLQDGASFLIAWELMSLGGALMILGENNTVRSGVSVLFMLTILEVGAVALLIALLLLGHPNSSLAFADFARNSAQLSPATQFIISVLLILGFGAKLGLLPFYEWLPRVYGAGSGASGAILSGVILNAAFFGLTRGLCEWLPLAPWSFTLGILLVLLAVLTAIFTILHAFQQTDWRQCLSFSSAENAAIAVTTLGASLLFRQSNLPTLAALAVTVAMLHLAAHALAKGTLFLAADGVYRSTGSYAIAQNGIFKQRGWCFGIGALFAAMSLAAMPPQSGFVSEWFVFQTIFQGFYLPDLAGRLTLIFAGAGLALTAALSFATFAKAFGVGLLGARRSWLLTSPFNAINFAVLLLGLLVLALAVGMPLWLDRLGPANEAWFGVKSAISMHTGWLLVPLTAHFAFISPSLLIIVGPLLALIPLTFLFSRRHYAIRRVKTWFGGLPPSPQVATTALTFSNAMRTFYGFIYRPTRELAREYVNKPYFMKSMVFSQRVTSVFDDYLFQPILLFIDRLANKVRLLQSGNLNFYCVLIGLCFVLILSLVLLI